MPPRPWVRAPQGRVGGQLQRVGDCTTFHVWRTLHSGPTPPSLNVGPPCTAERTCSLRLKLMTLHTKGQGRSLNSRFVSTQPHSLWKTDLSLVKTKIKHVDNQFLNMVNAKLLTTKQIPSFFLNLPSSLGFEGGGEVKDGERGL